VLSGPGPFAFGHRVFGITPGEDPDRPIENTTEAVRVAYRSGIRIVEMDVQVTVDGWAVVFHDDFLPDFTCINDLTYGELVAINPNIPKLRHVLNVARSFTRKGDAPQGVMTLEIKTPSPLCDPSDSTELALVQAVVHEVRQARMNKQVILESFSPAILAFARDVAPDLPRALAMSILQFLSPAQVQAATGLPVTLINKDVGLELQWAITGPFFRLPGYASVPQFVGVALALDARAVDLDVFFLATAESSQPGSGAGVVALMHQFDFSVCGFTVDDAGGWGFLESLGIDGIFIDDVPLGVALQAPF
jgi:glycerophosphoryl diester phosphodiesterase